MTQSSPILMSGAMVRAICWFSCGAASAVATKLALRKHGLENVVIAYCETHAEDPDNERFLKDCERWFNAPVTRLASTEYADTWDVWERRRYLAGVNGATCTVELKVAPRLEFQRPHDIHVFGYTLEEAKRAERFRANHPELKVEAPLIEAGLRKRDCLAMVKNAGIELPALYALGFQNNNCMPCVKATSPDYWALVRKVRPEHFARMAKLSRELDVRLARLKGRAHLHRRNPCRSPDDKSHCAVLRFSLRDCRTGDRRMIPHPVNIDQFETRKDATT